LTETTSQKLEPRKPGRPTVITPEVIDKLETAFSMGCTDTEACLYANISRTALFEYMAKNPDFRARREELKDHPMLLARTTVYNALADNLANAQWYLERKLKKEFSPRAELTGADGKDIIPIPILGGITQNNEDQGADSGVQQGILAEAGSDSLGQGEERKAGEEGGQESLQEILEGEDSGTEITSEELG